MQNKIRVLITIDWFLPGTKSGGPVRSYANLIEHLDEGFEFFIITRNTDYGSNDAYNVKPNTWIEFNNYTRVYYMSADQLSKSKLKTVISATNFDVTYVNGIYSWYFSILPVLILKKLNKPIIVSARGMLNPQAFSVKKNKKKIYLKLAKFFKIYKSVQFHATNPDEANYIRNEIGQNAIVRIAPNLPRKIDRNLRSDPVKQSPVQFVNIARIAKEKGTLKMLKALKQIKQSLQLDIYGPIYDQSYWDKCLNVISSLPEHIVVEYKGVLDSNEVPNTLSQYDFFVLLSEGENFGHAILEAFSAGLPVIISDKTPWRDLETKHIGWDVDGSNVENITEAYKKAIQMTSDDYKLCSGSAIQFAREFISNPELLEQNKALFLNALKVK